MQSAESYIQILYNEDIKYNNKSRQTTNTFGINKERIECYVCYKFGRFARDCRSKSSNPNVNFWPKKQLRPAEFTIK